MSLYSMNYASVYALCLLCLIYVVLYIIEVMRVHRAWCLEVVIAVGGT